jgi:hypothetical protein
MWISVVMPALESTYHFLRAKYRQRKGLPADGSQKELHVGNTINNKA